MNASTARFSRIVPVLAPAIASVAVCAALLASWPAQALGTDAVKADFAHAVCLNSAQRGA